MKKVQNTSSVDNALWRWAGWLQLWPTDQKLFWLTELIAFFSAAVEITRPCVHHARVEDNYESFKIFNFLDKHSVCQTEQKQAKMASDGINRRPLRRTKLLFYYRFHFVIPWNCWHRTKKTQKNKHTTKWKRNFNLFLAVAVTQRN